jgi:hypothetical protein
MNRKICLPMLALLAAPALAQEAPPAKAERTLISVGYGSDFGIFVETPLANPGPKVEAWVWNILKEPKQIPGATYDMTVSRDVIDCTAWTRTQLYTDGFLGDTHLGRSPGDVKNEALGADANEAVAKILCGKVDVSKDTPIADIAAARRLTTARLKPQ